jgi:hypothetical protein
MSRAAIFGLGLGLLTAGGAIAQAAAEPSTTPPAATPDMTTTSPMSPLAAPEAVPPTAPTRPADIPTATASSGPIVTYVLRAKKATFAHTTTGNATFAVIGALAAISEGKKIVDSYQVEDPAVGLARDLAASFAASKGGSLAPAPIMIDGEKADDVTPKAAGARYIVDVQTQAWNSIYFPLDWTHYGLIYGAIYKIIDVQDAKVLGKGRCFVKPKHSADSPTGDQLLNDQAAGLKKLDADAAAECLSDLKTKIAGL